MEETIKEMIEKFDVEVMQDRYTVANVLSVLFRSLNQKTGVERILYNPDGEDMIIEYVGGGSETAHVGGDSPGACIRDIMKHI